MWQPTRKKKKIKNKWTCNFSAFQWPPCANYPGRSFTDKRKSREWKPRYLSRKQRRRSVRTSIILARPNERTHTVRDFLSRLLPLAIITLSPSHGGRLQESIRARWPRYQATKGSFCRYYHHPPPPTLLGAASLRRTWTFVGLAKDSVLLASFVANFATCRYFRRTRD